MPVRAVLWDIDGTLLDANLSIRDTMNRVLAERGLATFSKGELDSLIGNPLRHILAKKTDDKAAVEAMALRYRVLYNETGWLLADFFPGILDVVRLLRARGIRQGIVTSKGQQEAETLLFDLGAATLFDVVVGDDDERPLKPDPAPVLAGAERLGLAPTEVAMVGDTKFDVLAGKSAGAHALGVLWGNGSRESLVEAGADAVARDPDGLERLLLRLASR